MKKQAEGPANRGFRLAKADAATNGLELYAPDFGPVNLGKCLNSCQDPDPTDSIPKSTQHQQTKQLPPQKINPQKAPIYSTQFPKIEIDRKRPEGNPPAYLFYNQYFDP
ncbi:hypothetical protein [Edaphobacter aggregans]|uniref:hypothetical protein n=1 Tax=Edaphobacter aggregans TaxID=570835 RepID=UPI0012F9CF93|nr:hypothetical protein [Edaphobacter aggregans]